MFKKFARAGRLKAALEELRLALGAAPVIFAAEASTDYEKLAADVALTEREISQSFLLIEGLSFFTHYVSRLAFRRNDETMREAIEPAILSAAKMVSDMLKAVSPDKAHPENLVLDHINYRDVQYASAKSWIPHEDDEEETDSLVGLAAYSMADAVGQSSNVALKIVLRVCLLRQIEACDWSVMFKNIILNL